MDLRFFVILHEYLLLLSASALACDLESSHGSCESRLAVYILAFAFFEADTFFPDLDNNPEWEKENEEEIVTSEKYPFKYVTYVRRKK